MTDEREAVAILDTIIPIFWRLGTVVAGIVAIAAGFLYVKQDSLLYFPEIGGIPRRPRQNPRRYRSPQENDLPFENHRIICEDGVSIHAWLILQPRARQSPTLVFFHGNAGNIGLRLPNAVQMYHHLHVNILMVEYRGYGDSDGHPSEAGLKLDSEAALRFISAHQGVDPNQIYLFGRSLGGAVAFHLAQYAEREGIPLAGVIVENTFLGISQMVDHLMPLVAPLKSLVLRIGWDSQSIVTQIKTPVLYLAGAKDQLVPHEHMLQLYELSSKSSHFARIHIVENGTHNETWLQGGRKYWERIQSFIAEVTAFDDQGTFRRRSSMEDVPLEDISSSTVGTGVRSRAVGLGGGDVDQMSSIPIMPTNIISMAKEAAKTSTTQTTNSKKKE